MTFVVAHRHSGFAFRRGVMRAGRRLIDNLRARTSLTPQERANLYVSRMPIAVITASLGGHPSSGSANRL
jgi:hypothetical protein